MITQIAAHRGAVTGSFSTNTSENNTVLVASCECELTPSPTRTGLPKLVDSLPQFPEGRTILGHPHGDVRALPGQLECPRAGTFNRKVDRIGVVRFDVAELNRRHAVAVNREMDER